VVVLAVLVVVEGVLVMLESADAIGDLAAGAQADRPEAPKLTAIRSGRSTPTARPRIHLKRRAGPLPSVADRRAGCFESPPPP
jgi:hypothetical protein